MVSASRRGAAIDLFDRDDRSQNNILLHRRAEPERRKGAVNISALSLNDLVTFILPINNFVE
jgi:hypothetical protein